MDKENNMADLADRIEAAGEFAAQEAMNDAPWAAQYAVSKMQHAANCFSVAAAIRARTLKEGTTDAR